MAYLSIFYIAIVFMFSFGYRQNQPHALIKLYKLYIKLCRIPKRFNDWSRMITWVKCVRKLAEKLRRHSVKHGDDKEKII